MADFDYNHSTGHETKHATEHRTEHSYATEKAIFGSELAEKPLEVAIDELDRQVRELGLYAILFPYEPEYEPDAQPEPVAQEADLLELEDIALFKEKLIKQVNQTALSKKEKIALLKLIEQVELPDAQALENQELSQLKSFGKLLNNDRSFMSEEIKHAMKLLSSLFHPVGMGWASTFDYQYLLARDFFNTEDPAFIDKALLNETLSARLRHDVEKKLGKETSEQLWQALLELTQQRKEKYENGIVPRYPRSARQLSLSCLCSENVAVELISLLKQLPTSPIEDFLGSKFPENQRRQKKYLHRLEGNISQTSNNGRYLFTWTEKLQRKINKYQTPEINHYIEAIKQITNGYIKKGSSVDDLVNRVDDLNSLSNSQLQDLATLILETADNKTAKKLQQMITRTETFKQASELKPEIAEFVCNFQKDAIRENDFSLLKPLTKADICRGLGYESSNPGKNKNNDKPDRQAQEKINIGRRMERYMKTMEITLPDGRVIPLEFLITGRASVTDVTNTQLASGTVDIYIQEIIDNENKEKPLSDQKISVILKKEYGIKIARKTVEKHRNKIGIPSSQGR